jgi:DNA modification methylase
MIKLDKDNVRIHPEANKTAISKSLAELGAGRSILLDADDVLIAGNGVYEQAEAMGLPIRVIETDGSELVAVKRTDLSTDDEKRKALAIADNRLTDLSEFDTEALNVMLDELSPDMQELAGYAIDPNDLMNEGNTDEDEIPEVTEATCKLGDLWILGEHRLLCGDSTDKVQVEQVLNGYSPDMIFTDPPYGMNAVKNSGVLKEKYRDVIGDDSTETAITSFLISMSLQPQRIIYWGANYYPECLPSAGCWLVWDKNNGGSDQADAELAWTNFKGVVRKYTKASEKINRVHPTQKPVELVSWVFDRWGLQETVVHDPFLGSGSTLIACEKTNRKCYGMELDPHYCDVIIKRWEDYTGETAVLDA